MVVKNVELPEYSVLMSVYAGEKPEHFRASIESMLSQTYVTNDFVLVCDGKLTKELDEVVDYYEENYECFTHTGFMYIYTPDKTMLESIYQADYTGDPDSAQLCATHTERGIAIRALGHSGEEIFDAFQNIAEKIRT